MDIARKLKQQHLRLILRISETGKLQTAADDLAMSQPAASRILADIETEVQSPLFERTPKGMITTPIGKSFERHARLIITNFESLSSEVRNLNAGDAGKVRIGSVTGPAVGNLVPTVQQIRANAPELEITIEVGPSTELVRGLEEGLFDFVIARLPPEYNVRNFRIFPARNETVSLLVKGDHPLSSRKKLRLHDLSSFDWVIQERGSPIRKAVEDAFLQDQVALPEKVINSSSLLIALSMLATSDIIAPQTNEVAQILSGPALNAKIVSLDLAETIHVSPYFVIKNRGAQLSPAAQNIMQSLLRSL